MNLSIFSILDLSQIKDLADVKGAKTGKIHILYVAGRETTRMRTMRAHDDCLGSEGEE